jgi:phosphatidylserine/phosphatidylglycerophosphate/cardiolipin synthase-like enzyme
MSVTTGDQERKSDEADIEARRITQDRIFIAGIIQREKVLERWQWLMGQRDGGQFLNDWRELHDALIKMAREGLDIED